MDPLFRICNTFDLQRTVRAQRVAFRRAGLPWVLLGVCVLLLADFAVAVWWLDPVLMGATGAGFLFAALYLLFAPELRGRAVFRQAQKTYADGAAVFTFTPDVIVTESKLGRAELSYAPVRRIVETDELFLLYMGKRMALILPKDGFELGTPDAFKTFLWEKTGVEIAQSRRTLSMPARIVLAVVAAGCLVGTYFATNAVFDARYFSETAQIAEANADVVEELAPSVVTPETTVAETTKAKKQTEKKDEATTEKKSEKQTEPTTKKTTEKKDEKDDKNNDKKESTTQAETKKKS